MIRPLRSTLGTLGRLLPAMVPLYVLLAVPQATLVASMMLLGASLAVSGRLAMSLYQGLKLVYLIGTLALLCLPFALTVGITLLVWAPAIGWSWLALLDWRDACQFAEPLPQLPEQKADATERADQGDWHATPASLSSAQGQL